MQCSGLFPGLWLPPLHGKSYDHCFSSWLCPSVQQGSSSAPSPAPQKFLGSQTGGEGTHTPWITNIPEGPLLGYLLRHVVVLPLSWDTLLHLLRVGEQAGGYAAMAIGSYCKKLKQIDVFWYVEPSLAPSVCCPLLRFCCPPHLPPSFPSHHVMGPALGHLPSSDRSRAGIYPVHEQSLALGMPKLMARQQPCSSLETRVPFSLLPLVVSSVC